MTWDRINDQMERLHPGEFFSKDGRVLQTTEPTTEQLNILKQLKISPQERIRHIVMTLKSVGKRTKIEHNLCPLFY